MRDLVRDLARQGHHAIALLNGHMENTAFAGEGVDLAVRERITPDLKVVLINWWEEVGDGVIARLFPEGFPGWEAEHASLTETSLMQHFLPHLVLPERLEANQTPRPLPTYGVWPEPPGLVPESGVLYQAHGASAEKGQALAQQITARIVAILRAEFPEFGQVPG